jgi:hypothetical protein
MPNYGPNTFAPGVVSDAFIPDQLIAGNLQLVTDTVTLTGGAALVRGSVLGETVSAATAASAAGTNTGNGVMGAVTASGNVREGVYQVRISKVVANAGDFDVIDPAGFVVGVGSVGVAFNRNGLAFTLADGATDFALGDTFNITVSALTVKHKLSLRAAGDGSSVAKVILADNADPSGGDISVPVYRMGEFNANALTLGSGHTLDSVKAQLAPRGIFLRTPVTATDPT